jgi:VanZ family protein
MLRRIVLLGWVALVLALTVPWTSLRSHAHWDRVAWIPFQSGIVKFADVGGNIVLYAPLGWWLAQVARPRHADRVVHAALSALLLSTLCESSQVYSHGRFPSATDVAANTIGAVAGALLAIWWMRLKSRSSLP